MPRKPDAKNLSRRVLVTINRDMTATTSRVVWQHEIPILEAIHGEGKVEPIDPADLDEGYNPKASPELLIFNKKQDQIPPPSESHSIGWVFAGDARAEYDRLTSLYGMHPDVKETMAEHVYGRFQEGRFEAVLGKAEVEDLPEAQLRDLIRSYGVEPERLKAATTPEALRALAEEHSVALA